MHFCHPSFIFFHIRVDDKRDSVTHCVAVGPRQETRGERGGARASGAGRNAEDAGETGAQLLCVVPVREAQRLNV